MQLSHQLEVENMRIMTKNINEQIGARLSASRSNPASGKTTQTIIQEVMAEAMVDSQYDLHQKLAEKEKEMFPDAQERQQRKFQLQENVDRRLELIGSPEDIFSLIQVRHSTYSSYALPDFLELTPEQADLIKAIQKETYYEILTYPSQSTVGTTRKAE